MNSAKNSAIPPEDRWMDLEARAIAALVRVEAPVLEQLARQAEEVAAMPRIHHALRLTPALEAQHRLLGSLLRLSERNLRLLRLSHQSRMARTEAQGQADAGHAQQAI